MTLLLYAFGTSFRVAGIVTTSMDSRLEEAEDKSGEQERKSSANPQSSTASPIDLGAEARSKAIDRVPEEDTKILKDQANVLPLGAFSMREIVKQLKTTDTDDSGLTENELLSYRYNIHQFVLTCVKALLGVIDASSALLEGDVEGCYEFLRDYVSKHTNDDATLTEEAAGAIEALWTEPSVTEAHRISASDIKDSSA